MYQLESKPGQARRLHLDPRATPPNCFPGNTGTAAHVLTFILVCSVLSGAGRRLAQLFFLLCSVFASSVNFHTPCLCPCLSERANARASAGTRALNRQPASQQPPSPHHQPPPNQTKPNQPRHHTRQGRPRKTEEEPPWATKNLPTASSSSLPPLWLRSSFALAPNRSSKSSCVCRGIQTVVIRTPLLCLAVPASRDTICHFASFSLLLSLSQSPSVAHSLLPPSLSLCLFSLVLPTTPDTPGSAQSLPCFLSRRCCLNYTYTIRLSAPCW